MNKYLKGNYTISHSENVDKSIESNDFTKIFESKALEKLGGSIAFVIKTEKFVWEGGDDAQ